MRVEKSETVEATEPTPAGGCSECVRLKEVNDELREACEAAISYLLYSSTSTANRELRKQLRAAVTNSLPARATEGETK
jgi:hypothetical protein